MHEDDRRRALLTAHRDRVQARVSKLEAELDALIRARRSESDDDEHDPEGETLSSQWSMLAGRLESAREEARQTANALRRLDEGAYGVCVDCASPIPHGQLEARPFRERCVSCAS